MSDNRYYGMTSANACCGRLSVKFMKKMWTDIYKQAYKVSRI